MTAGVALQLAGLVGFVNAVDVNAPMVRLLAATTIFVDGTKDIFPTSDSQTPDRMRGTLNSALDQGHDYESAPGVGGNYYVQYPRAFGIVTGLNDPSYDTSRGIATQNMITAIKDARTQNPGDPIYVVGFSQGANAQADAIRELQDSGYDTSDITFVMVGNGARNDGGLWARLPAGVYVPLLGLSFGASTNPDPNGPQVIQISKQYDGASDVPRYIFNPVGVVNAVMGFTYVHNGYYQDVDFDLNGDGVIDSADVALAQQDPDHYIVTTNGNVSDVVIRNADGQLPLTRPLLDMGVPPEVVKALDPLLRAIIETGYSREPNGGEYSAEPQHFELMSPVTQWQSDADSVSAGLQETIRRLGALNSVQVNPISPSTASPEAPQAPQDQQLSAPTDQEPASDPETLQVGTLFGAREAADQPDPEPAAGTLDQTGTSQAGQDTSGALDPVSPPTTPDTSVEVVQVADQPGSEPSAGVLDQVDTSEVVQDTSGLVDPVSPPATVKKPSTPQKPRTNLIRGPIGGSPSLSGPKKATAKINGAVTDAISKVTDAFSGISNGNKVRPKPVGSTAGSNTGTSQSDTGAGSSEGGSGATGGSGEG